MPPQLVVRHLEFLASLSAVQKSVCKAHPYLNLVRSYNTPTWNSNFHYPERSIMNTSYFQVLGTGQVDSFPSVGLMCPKVRLVFNCGENQQRVLAEHTQGIRLSSVNCFFFTRAHWSNVAGMPGSCLTHWQTRNYNLEYCGPKASSSILQSLVPFTMHPSAMPTARHLYSDEGQHEAVKFDDGVSVMPLVFKVPITKPSEPSARHPFVGSSPLSSDCESDGGSSRRTSCSPPSPKRKFTGLTPGKKAARPAVQQDYEVSTAYVVRMPSVPGTFLPKKALQLGVERGQMFGVLSSGQSVTLSDGRVVSPDDVTEPTNKGMCFIVVECATPDFTVPITSSPLFAQWQCGGRDADLLAVIVHMTPQHVVNTDAYQAWIQCFAPDVQHLFLNRTVSASPLVQFSGSQLQSQLNVIDERVFPMPYYNYEKPDAAQNLPANCRSGDLMLCFALYKHTGRKNAMQYGWSDLLVQKPIEVAAIQSSLKAIDRVSQELDTLHGQLTALERSSPGAAGGDGTPMVAETEVDEKTATVCLDATDCQGKAEGEHAACPAAAAADNLFLPMRQDSGLSTLAAATELTSLSESVMPWSAESSVKFDIPADFDPTDSDLVFLGTGAAIPGKYRNVSAILLRFGDLSMLMDGGEGTLCQMYRQFGPELDRVLCGLRLITISHIHADHQSGITSVLLERKAAGKRLGIELPPCVVVAPMSWRTFFKHIDETMRMPEIRYVGTHRATEGVLDEVLLQTGLPIDKLRTHSVLHSVPAWATEVRIRGARQQDGSPSKKYTVVYSGDTMHCKTLAQAAMGADLLIHEATFCNQMSDKAADKKHSTIGEALDIGAQMKASFVVLTHFSQRYKMPDIKKDALTSSVPFGVAFDMMSVRLSELHRLHKHLVMLRLLFDAREGLIAEPGRRSPSPGPHATGKMH